MFHSKNIQVINATCPDVIKTHDLIKNYLKELNGTGLLDNIGNYLKD